jgi:hypothetical protein
MGDRAMSMRSLALGAGGHGNPSLEVPQLRGITRMKTSMALCVLAIACSVGSVRATQTDINGPQGSAHFGAAVHALSNGNFVVADPDFDSGRGAVHLYSRSHALISTLRGATHGDKLGAQGIHVLPSGNFVVCNPSGNVEGNRPSSGSVTWVNGTTGLNGTVSAQNSLFGTHADDQVGKSCTVLRNGNFFVLSPLWDRPVSGVEIPNVGAATWASGTSGISGPVSAQNSLLGNYSSEVLGYAGIVELMSGDAVLMDPNWGHEGAVGAGAAIWLDGVQPTTGEVDETNALIGSHASDSVGTAVFALSDGSFYVRSEYWSNGAAKVGALTWCDGVGPCAGTVSAANSILGSTANDMANATGLVLADGKLLMQLPFWNSPGAPESGAVVVLTPDRSLVGSLDSADVLHGANAGDHFGKYAKLLDNGNVVAWSGDWHIGGVGGYGAVALINPRQPEIGAVSQQNALIATGSGSGSTLTVTPIKNGRYVVACPDCEFDGVQGAGGVVWADQQGISGIIASDNSLHGTTSQDRVGAKVAALANGNYVVGSPAWDNTLLFANAGAATWVNGANGKPMNELQRGAAVSANNSLIGRRIDFVGLSVVALSNGNYLVGSPAWRNVSSSVGAITWADGSVGLATTVDPSNSLIGSWEGDQVGDLYQVGTNTTVLALPNGNAVVGSPRLDYVTESGNHFEDVGAVTWIDGNHGATGPISAGNSLMGSFALDAVGGFLVALSEGDYMIWSPYADKCVGIICNSDVGAWTPVPGSDPVLGGVNVENSVFGGVSGEGVSQTGVFNEAANEIMIGRPGANMVSVVGFSQSGGSIFKNGFD